MASSDNLWFEMGVRDEVSKKLSEILNQAEELQDVMDSITIGRDAVKNASDIEQALDKIAVARNRISDARLLTKDKDDLDSLKKMDKELAKVQKTFENLAKMGDDVTQAMMGTKGMAAYVKMLNNLPLVIDQVRRKTGDITAKAAEEERIQAREAERVDALKEKYYELFRIRKSLQDAVMSAAPGVDTTEATKMIYAVNSRLGAVTRAQSSGGGMPSSVVGADNEEMLRRAKEMTRELGTATEDYKRKLSSVKDVQLSLQRVLLDTQSQQNIAGIKKQTVEYGALGRKLQEIENLMERVDRDRRDFANGTIKTPAMTRDVVAAELEAIQRRYNEEVARGKQLERDDAEAKNQKSAATKKAAEAVQLLSHVNSGLVSSYNRIAEAGSKANRITIQLQNQVAGYAGLYGIERLVKSIVTIGGQFEFQHIALQNILGDVQQANTLFSQLQAMAIESPKTFMELTSYTKQLSAYQIPYEELFDTTKRLADISTGLGVDMSRLILAYGQVRSAAVLRGQELRQFTEAGIPLVQALADKFTQLNGRVVTTGEVFELISKRAVSFEMVRDILWDMTNEGGQFHDMQAELADTLYGKYQKLQDSWQIMLGRIADGNNLAGKFFKISIEGVVALVNAFDMLMPVLTGYALNRVSKNLIGSVRNKIKGSDAAAIKTMEVAKMEQATRLERERLFYGKQLTKEEQNLVRYKDKLLSNEYAILAAEDKISMKKAHQLMLEGQMTKTHFRRLLQMKGYTAEQRKQIMNGNRQLIQQMYGDSMWKKAGQSVLGFMGGWSGVGLMAAGAAVALYENAERKAEASRDAAMAATKEMLDTFEEANNLYNELTRKSPESADDLSQAISRITNVLKETGGYNTDLEEQIGQVDSLTDKYNLLFQALGGVSSKYLEIKERVEAAIEAGNRVGGSLWSDDMNKDLEQLAEASKELKVAETRINAVQARMKGALKEYLSEQGRWNESTMGAKNWKDIYGMSNIDSEAFVEFLGEKEWEDGIKMMDEYVDALKSVASARKEVDKQMPESAKDWYEGIEQQMIMANIDPLNLVVHNEETGEDEIAVEDEDLRRINGWINSLVLQVAKDNEQRDLIRKSILDQMPEAVRVKIQAMPVVEIPKMAPWQEDLQKYFKEHKINIPVDAQTTMEKVEKDLQNEHKRLKENIERNGKILLKFKFDLENLPDDIDKAIEGLPKIYRNFVKKALKDYSDEKKTQESVEQAGKDLGLDVNGKTTNKADEQLKQWREELKEIKAFWSEYEKFLRYMTSSEAVEEIRRKGLFPSLFKDGQLTMDVRGGLGSALDALLGKTNGSTTERKAFQVEVKQARADVDLKDKEETAKNILSQLDEALKEQGKRWDLYKKILEATGSREQAGRIAFGEDLGFKNRAEQLRAEVAAGTQQTGKSVDELLGMDDESLHQLGIFEKAANGIYQKLKLLKDEEQKVKAEEVELFVDALKNAKSLDTELEQIRVRYERTRAAITSQQTGQERDTLIANANKNEAKEVADKQWEYFKKSDGWGRIFGNLDRVSTATLRGMRDELTAMLPKVSGSVESMKALYEALEKINKAMAERNPFAAMASGATSMSRLGQLARSQVFGADGKGTFTPDKKSAKYYGLQEGRSYSKDEIKDLIKQAGNDFSKGVDGVVKGFQAVQDVLGPVIDLFDVMGMHEASQFMQMGSNALGAASQVAGGLNALGLGDLGPYGAAIGAGLSVVSSLFSMHDASLQKEIEASQARQKEMENLTKNLETALERTLGDIYRTEASEKDLKKLREYGSKYDKAHDANPNIASWYKFSYGYISDDSKAAIDKALESESYYDTKFAEMSLQRDELNKQLQAEQSKKDSSDTAIEDYKQQIAELEDEIDHFAEDMAESIYGIDVKSWASELGDALFEAWQKGEDGAEAFKKKAREVITDVAKRIAVLSLIETAMEPVLDVVRNEMKRTSGKLDEESVANIAAAMGVVGETLPDAFNKLMDGLDQGLQKAGLGSMKDDAESTTANKVIQGGFTENETGLLLSYINAMRADLSVQRMDVYGIRQLLEGNFSEMPVLARAQLQQLQQIAQNTYRNADAADAIYNLLHRLAPDGQKLRVG